MSKNKHIHISKTIFSVCIMAIFFSFSSYAEIKKEYQLEDDGFEWYKIYDSDTKKTGAQDLQGNQIVPMQFDKVSYFGAGSGGWDYLPACFRARVLTGVRDPRYSDQNIELTEEALYTISGKCIIPIERRFNTIGLYEFENKLYISFVRGKDCHEYGICDINGKILFRKYSDGIVSVVSLYEDHYLLGQSPITTKLGFDHEPYQVGVNDNLPHPLANAPAKWDDNPSHEYSSTASHFSENSDNSSIHSNGSQPIATGTYTISQQGRSVTTGNYTGVAGPDMTVTIEFYDDGITVNGLWCEYAGESSGRKRYDGMSFAGSSETYYVDAYYNVQKQMMFSSPYGTDWFDYTVVKGEVSIPKATPYQAPSSSYSGSSHSTGHGHTHTTKTYQPDCHLCGGSGKCRTCNGTHYYINPLTGKYVTCPNCKPDGLCSACGGTGKKR